MHPIIALAPPLGELPSAARLRGLLTIALRI